LVAAGLLAEQDGRFANTPETQHFLVKDSPAYMGHIHRRLAENWRNMLQTATSLRTGIPQAHVDFSHSPPEEVEALLRLINAQAVATAQALVECCDFSTVQTLVDVGGGGGGLALHLTQACPHLHVTVVDLPQVTPLTQKLVDEAGSTVRVAVVATDVVQTPVPGAYDAAVLQRVIQVLSREDAYRVIQHTSAAIRPGGTLYILGQILDDSRTSPPMSMGSNLNFINLYYTGEAYTEHEHRTWLKAAGLVDIERPNISLAGGYSLMTARKREE
jgi:2-polyprenyl-3-methyl-5-hydroxy-6-metoxy-1,4-benzoquinol methylase